MATITAMSLTSNPTKCLILNSHNLNPSKPTIKPISLPPLPKGLSTKSSENSNPSSPLVTGSAIAGVFFSSLSFCDSSMAVQQIAEIAEGGDNRGLALLLPIIPALGWVLYNILQPALNQINRMRVSKGVLVGLGLSGLAASSFMVPSAEAAEATSTDNRGQLLLFVILPAIGWVLYNILQPALNQFNRMKSQ